MKIGKQNQSYVEKYQGRYPVIHLEFGKIDTEDENYKKNIQTCFANALQKAYKKHKYLLKVFKKLWIIIKVIK